MSTTVAPLPVERERIEAVDGLFDALVRFSRSLKARGGDWGNLAQDLTRGDIVTLGVRRGPRQHPPGPDRRQRWTSTPPSSAASSPACTGSA